MSEILVTGAAGFIGFHLAERLLAQGERVCGLDNLNDYYEVNLKQARLARLLAHPQFRFVRMDLADGQALGALFRESSFGTVVHLAAQAGVRYSIKHPEAYVRSNLVGFANILEGCRHSGVKHLVFASSSSVYGANSKLPFSVSDNVDHPVSLYAATKKSNELMAHAYAHLFRIPCTGLRFFTVYGPWGRPDMALFSFTKAILEDRAIDVYNHGKMRRDFTYIDDIVEGVVRVMRAIPAPRAELDRRDGPEDTAAPYRIYNIGNNRPVELLKVIEVLEAKLGRKAVINFMPMQAGDVPATYANIDSLVHDVGFRPNTKIEDGIEKFVQWYREYYRHEASAPAQAVAASV